MVAARISALAALTGVVVLNHAPYSNRTAALVLSAALHILWVTLLLDGKHPAVAAACWLTAVAATRSPGEEILLLMAAVSSTPGLRLADRLAEWRQAQAAIGAQLRMSEGITGWLRRCLRQAWRGEASSAIQAAHLSVQTALHVAGRAAAKDIAGRIEQEQFRQLALTAVETVASKTSLAFARAAIDCEQEAITAAAQLRSEARALRMDAAERERLTTYCESLLLGLTIPGHRPEAKL